MNERHTAKSICERFYSQDDAIRVQEMDVFYKPDILTITRSLLVKEFEIKCSYQDLKSELDVIDKVRQEGAELRPRLWTNSKGYLDSNKEVKHFKYLVKRDPTDYTPNFFYFIMPKDLYEKTKDRFKGLPYGVIDADWFFNLRAPRKLHDEVTVTEPMLWQICRYKSMKLSQTETYIKKMEDARCWNCRKTRAGAVEGLGEQ